MSNDPITVIYRVQKSIKGSLEQLGEAMMSGSVDSMEKYKYLLGQAHALQLVQQDISNLLEEKEPNNDRDNIVKFGSPED
jgi:hypothetical protein